MQSEKQKKFTFIFRVLIASLVWIVLLSTMFRNLFILEIDGSRFIAVVSSYRFYTIQTNLWVGLWIIFSLVSYADEKKQSEKLNAIHGAVVLYITVTFLIYAFILDPLHNPETVFDQFVTICTHYIVPIAFILDYVISEKKNRYKWKYLVYWLSYPCLYLVFALIYGSFTGNYIYPFLNIVQLGVGRFLFGVLILICIYLILGSIYIAINRKGDQRYQSRHQ